MDAASRADVVLATDPFINMVAADKIAAAGAMIADMQAHMQLLEEDKEFAERAANAVAKACTYGTDKLQTAVEASDHAWLAEELRVKSF